MYRQRQQTVTSNLAQQKAETAQLQQFFGGMGPVAAPASTAPPTGPAAAAGGGAGGATAGAQGGMPMAPGGMNEEMMAQAFQQMMAQGMDPSTMDFGAFMSMAGGGGMPGFGAPTGPQAGFGAGGGGSGGGRRGGRGRGNW
jgi:pre-mRNA 3'-end-processing factor FIP1